MDKSEEYFVNSTAKIFRRISESLLVFICLRYLSRRMVRSSAALVRLIL